VEITKTTKIMNLGSFFLNPEIDFSDRGAGELGVAGCGVLLRQIRVVVAAAAGCLSRLSCLST